VLGECDEECENCEKKMLCLSDKSFLYCPYFIKIKKEKINKKTDNNKKKDNNDDSDEEEEEEVEEVECGYAYFKNNKNGYNLCVDTSFSSFENKCELCNKSFLKKDGFLSHWKNCSVLKKFPVPKIPSSLLNKLLNNKSKGGSKSKVAVSSSATNGLVY
jgi:hypothetical protein